MATRDRMTRKRRLQERMLDRRIPSEHRDAKDVERHGAMRYAERRIVERKRMKMEIIYRSPFEDVSIVSNDGLYQLRQKIFNFIYASSTTNSTCSRHIFLYQRRRSLLHPFQSLSCSISQELTRNSTREMEIVLAKRVGNSARSGNRA